MPGALADELLSGAAERPEPPERKRRLECRALALRDGAERGRGSQGVAIPNLEFLRRDWQIVANRGDIAA